MALASVKESEGVISPLWETAPYYGVVSLLDMLDFAARDYLEICYRFGRLMAEGKEHEDDVVQHLWTNLIKETQRLDLPVTREHIVCLFEDLARKNPTKGKFARDEFELTGATLSLDRLQHHVEAIYNTLRAELGSMLFKAIPRERGLYCDPKWLQDIKLPDQFPTSLKELQRAGNCYSIGESTACVFHSMRALEPGLNSLAKRFDVSYAHENWQIVIQSIEAEIRKMGNQPKSPEKIEDEKFFGGAASHLYFVKNAWRNHVAHTRENYNDTEALKIMRHTVQFIESLCPRLKEEI